MDELEILDPGPLSTIQDRGRAGHARLGVARSGAADRGSLALAHRLVANHSAAAGIEITLGPFLARAHGDLIIAVVGALTDVSVGGRPTAPDMAIAVPDRSEIQVGPARAGLRLYLVVRGGIATPAVLGSRSYDTLGAIGPSPLVAGQRLAIDEDHGGGAPWFEHVARRNRSDGPLSIRAIAGPDDDQITGGLGALTRETWTVSGASDRRGWRLAGPVIGSATGEGLSGPMLPGAIQVPPDGQPIVLGPDAGTTGGYPVVGVVADADLDVLGQVRPGDRLRFVEIGTTITGRG